jgi:hypothetical protein
MGLYKKKKEKKERKKRLTAPTQITLSQNKSIGWPIAWSDRCSEVRLE